MSSVESLIEDFDKQRAGGMTAFRPVDEFSFKDPRGNLIISQVGSIIYAKDYEEVGRWNDAVENSDYKPSLHALARDPENMVLRVITERVVQDSGQLKEKGLSLDRDADKHARSVAAGFLKRQMHDFAEREAQDSKSTRGEVSQASVSKKVDDEAERRNEDVQAEGSDGVSNGGGGKKKSFGKKVAEAFVEQPKAASEA